MAEPAVREAFCAVLEAAPEERAAVMAGLPAELREEVRSLWESYLEADRFLDAPEHVLEPGQALGPYRIVEVIGHGGMGTVYRAERADGEFQREVAIKIVGGRLFAPEAERRFIEERRILAKLDHPNIVRMLDGGVAGGLRYLVMELVEGQAVTAYCAERELGLAEKIRLAQGICGALHYLHQSLILHRDLKPQNIWVTAAGQPKLLDFGVAKMWSLEETAEGQTLPAMSLRYASPEQIRGERLTPASDIYSLGLVVYEMLAGRNPRAGAGVGEILAGLEKPMRGPGISEDLDAIVLKALAPEAGRRYASAEEMSRDLQRLLEGRPVEAKAPTRWYYARRFWGRNRALGVVLAGLVVAVAAGLVVSYQQTRLAERRFRQSRALIYTVIHDLQPKLGRINGTVAVRAELVASSLRYLEEMGRDAGNDAGLLRDLVGAYVELSKVTGAATEASLGKAGESGAMMAKAGELAEVLLRVDGRGRDSLRVAGSYFQAAARSEAGKGSAGKAEELGKRALEVAERVGGEDVAMACAALGDVTADAGRRAALYRRSISIWQGMGDKKRRNVALMYRNLSSTLLDLDDPAGALEAAERARGIDEGLAASGPVGRLDLAFDLGAVGAAHRAMGDTGKATVAYRRSVDLRAEVAAANPDDLRAAERLAFALEALGEMEVKERDLAAARADFARAAGIYERVKPTVFQSRLAWGACWASIARMERARGNAAGACGAVRSLREVARGLDGTLARIPYQKKWMERIGEELKGCPTD